MNALLLFAVLGAAEVPIPSATDARTACVDHDFQVMVSAPKERAAQGHQELDRRFQIVLAAERQAEAAVPAPRPLVEWGPPAALLALALLVALAAANRRSRAAALAAVLLASASSAVWARGALRQRAAEAAVSTLRDCRLRISDARSQLDHSDLARCIGDLSEADEDLGAWEANLKQGKPVDLPSLQKLRGELQHR